MTRGSILHSSSQKEVYIYIYIQFHKLPLGMVHGIGFTTWMLRTMSHQVNNQPKRSPYSLGRFKWSLHQEIPMKKTQPTSPVNPMWPYPTGGPALTLGNSGMRFRMPHLGLATTLQGTLHWIFLCAQSITLQHTAKDNNIQPIQRYFYQGYSGICRKHLKEMLEKSRTERWGRHFAGNRRAPNAFCEGGPS